MSYANTLAIMSWTDTKAPTIDELARQITEHEDNLASSMRACVLPVKKLTPKFSEQFRKNRSSSRTPTKVSAIRSQLFSVQGRGYQWHTPCATLWFFLCDQGEDMRNRMVNLSGD